VTKKDPKYNFLISADNIVVQAKDAMPTCEEIARLRKR
jgi:hypothetical protein